jgi:hypothetical protein
MAKLKIGDTVRHKSSPYRSGERPTYEVLETFSTGNVLVRKRHVRKEERFVCPAANLERYEP